MEYVTKKLVPVTCAVALAGGLLLASPAQADVPTALTNVTYEFAALNRAPTADVQWSGAWWALQVHVTSSAGFSADVPPSADHVNVPLPAGFTFMVVTLTPTNADGAGPASTIVVSRPAPPTRVKLKVSPAAVNTCGGYTARFPASLYAVASGSGDNRMQVRKPGKKTWQVANGGVLLKKTNQAGVYKVRMQVSDDNSVVYSNWSKVFSIKVTARQITKIRYGHGAC
jgi:hypothetical protein